MPSIIRGVVVATAASIALAAQTPDQEATKAILDGSLEVVRTASAQADRFETGHLILYVDKGVMPAEDARKFSADIERYFGATSQYLGRTFDRASRKVAKPSFYLTDRAGISHAESVRVFLRAQRVIPAPAIAIHETIHLLLMKDPDAPRNRADLTPEQDARLMAISGVWLAEGFANFATYELVPRLGIEPDRLFVKGDRTTVDAEALEWMRDTRGTHVLPFVGAHGVPEGLFADRPNVAAPFYVLSHSFIKHVVERAGRDSVIRLYERHFNGTRSIEEDLRSVTGRDLVQWREEWLRVIGASM